MQANRSQESKSLLDTPISSVGEDHDKNVASSIGNVFILLKVLHDYEIELMMIAEFQKEL